MRQGDCVTVDRISGSREASMLRYGKQNIEGVSFHGGNSSVDYEAEARGYADNQEIVGCIASPELNRIYI